MKKKVFQLIEGRGYQGRIIPIQHLYDLQKGIEAHYREGSFDEVFYQECLTGFDFNPPETVPEIRSLIVIAVKQPQVRFAFTWNGKQKPVIVPPTYLHWRKTDRDVEELLTGILQAEGYSVVQAELPKKLLAVCSGLAVYGRNNITYVAGMGSFHRLVSFYSDLPWEEGVWQETKMMEPCQRCDACLRHCPTGAISAERFLLHAQRCIVFHNEHPGDISFPAWMEAAWHNCLVGCMHCQRVCPENRDVLDWVEEGAAFSQEETALLAEGTPLDRLSAETVSKLKKDDLIDLMNILPRNLKVLLEG